tara:strand:- start:4223 stop:5287 length:1065 start_codon:yes stop_codon:yes gene_type:complete
MSKCAELANLIGNINMGGGGVNRNVLINSAMTVAQRGTSTASVSSGDFFVVDRFGGYINATGTWTVSQSTDNPDGQGFANSAKFDCTTANGSLASGAELQFRQRIEGQNLQHLEKGTSSAKPTALQFWVKSNKTGTYICELFDNDNSRTINKSYTISSANTWEKKTITFEGDTTGTLDNDNNTSLTVTWWLGAGSSMSSGSLQTSWGARTDANRAVGNVNLADSTDNEWYITGVQLEVGQNPTSFEHEPIERTLAKCQRYHFSMNHPELTTTRNHWMYAIETANTGAYRRVTIDLPTPMRAVPTVTADFNHTGGTNGVDGGNWTGYNSVSLYVNSINSSSDYAYVDDFVATAEL